MAEGPIDINGPRKSAEKNDALKEALQTIFLRVTDAQNKMNMRVEDLVKDVTDLTLEINDIIANLYKKYPELEPDMEEEELE